MKNIAELSINRVSRPIKVLQFGEGNFLRAFTDYMIDILNEKTDFNGNVAIVKPIPFGNLDSFKKQNNL
ncbi:MAG TPA: tagaturonate reductase, partial [Candidatus Avimonas sp.]|nr:tagaturonate reductase [Candidatus Avimonas sp.]